MFTKKQLLDALAPLKDDDVVTVGLLTPPDDDDDAGFSETESTVTEAQDDEDADPGYLECDIEETEVVDATDDSGAKQLILYANLPSDDDEDETIYVDDDGHYVNANDEYITKDGEPSATPVKADAEDLEDA